MIEDHVEFWADMEFEHAMMISRSLISHFNSFQVDEIHVVYNYFVNITQQKLNPKRCFLLFMTLQKINDQTDFMNHRRANR